MGTAPPGPPPTEASGPLPTFVVIGAQKSGTTWLAHNLGLHPDVFVAGGELEFFNHGRRYRRFGIDWYRAQFWAWSGEPVVGESTAGYLMLRHNPRLVARRIDETLPGVRLLAVLRNPVDRAQSAVAHHQRQRRLPPTATLPALVRDEPETCARLAILDGGRYAESLAPYVERFGDRLLVLLHDDVASEPVATYAAALRHVGADPDFVPPAISEPRNRGQVAADSAGVRRASPLAVASRAKRALLRQPRRADELELHELTPAERAELFEHFAGDVQRLEALIGRDLSCWRP